jgi:hypothetical protein
MPPKPAATTAAATRNRNGSLSTPDEFQDIKDSQDARKYLEKFSLLCPPGEPASNGALSICLHQIATMKGIPKQALNAVRAMAFLLERLEEEAINEKVRSAFDSQITEFTLDMKLLVEDINTKIDNHLKEAMAQWTQIVKSAPQPAVTNHSRTTPAAETNSYSYASALINPPPHVNPKLAAREGIRARQFVVEGAEHSDLKRLDHQKLKEDMNKALRDLGASEGNVRSIVTQREGEGTLIEVDSDALAKWLTNGGYGSVPAQEVQRTGIQRPPQYRPDKPSTSRGVKRGEWNGRHQRNIGTSLGKTNKQKIPQSKIGTFGTHLYRPKGGQPSNLQWDHYM